MVRYGTIKIQAQDMTPTTGVSLLTKTFPTGQTVQILRFSAATDCSANVQILIPLNVNSTQPIAFSFMFSSQSGTNTGLAQFELYGIATPSGSVVASPGYIASAAGNVVAAGDRVYLVDTLAGSLVYGPKRYARFQLWRRTAGNTLATGADLHCAYIRYRIGG